MRNTIIVNQAPHGIGPILRAAEMAYDLYHLLRAANPEQDFDILLTEPEKPFVENILKNETFTDIPERVWLSPVYGELVNHFDYSSDDYVDRLENIAANRANLELRLISELEKGVEAYNLVNENCKRIKAEDILCEVSHNPIVSTSKSRHPMFYTTIGLLSEILAYAFEVNPRYTKTELQHTIQACIEEAKTLEDSQTLLMIPEPSALSYRGKPKGDKAIEIPPFIKPPSGSREELQEGVYLNISGIEAVQERIASLAKPFLDVGYAVYYSPNYEKGITGGIPKAPVEKGISIFSNPAIIAAVGRRGWSSVWEPNMNGSPFITYEYDEKEDPEMHHNVKTIETLSLGIVFREGKNSKEVMNEALALRPQINDYYASLKRKYGTLNGINYAARKSFEILSAS